MRISSWFDRAAYKYTVIPRTREQTLQLSQRLALLMGDKVTEWGAGRVDTFNPYKGLQFNWQLSRLPIAGADRAPPISRRSGTRGRAPACSCTGTATTTRWTSAT